jgi:FtsP/CotA-like multicopper oxidase with cupredoxin domain
VSADELSAFPKEAVMTTSANTHPGTYWAHPHTGLDADNGLYLSEPVMHALPPAPPVV